MKSGNYCKLRHAKYIFLNKQVWNLGSQNLSQSVEFAPKQNLQQNSEKCQTKANNGYFEIITDIIPILYSMLSKV